SCRREYGVSGGAWAPALHLLADLWLVVEPRSLFLAPESDADPDTPACAGLAKDALIRGRLRQGAGAWRTVARSSSAGTYSLRQAHRSKACLAPGIAPLLRGGSGSGNRSFPIRREPRSAPLAMVAGGRHRDLRRPEHRASRPHSG